MTSALKQWLPLKEPEPMTVFDPKVWLQPRPPWIYGGSMWEKMSRVREQLIRELNLATDGQLHELAKGLYSMGHVRAELVIGEAKRQGLVKPHEAP
jgi:hypothetical protein